MAHDQPAAAPGEDFQRIFDRYYRPVHCFFMRRGFAGEEARDLAQETFLRVYRSMGQLRHDDSLESWLRQIAVNVWKNEIRRRTAGMRQGQEISLDGKPVENREKIAEVDTAMESPDTGPEDALLAREELALVRRSLNRLPPQMRRCFLLRIAQDLKYREIAAMMGLSIQTVKSHISQARQRLRE